MGDSKIFKNLLSKLNFFSFKYSGRANNAGIKNKVKRLENPSPQITAVENVDEVLKISLKKELKRVEWTEVKNISKTDKDQKSQASIQ